MFHYCSVFQLLLCIPSRGSTACRPEFRTRVNFVRSSRRSLSSSLLLRLCCLVDCLAGWTILFARQKQFYSLSPISGCNLCATAGLEQLCRTKSMIRTLRSRLHARPSVSRYCTMNNEWISVVSNTLCSSNHIKNPFEECTYHRP
jgi:hypothetical protein